jgi:hypothetical protein
MTCAIRAIWLLNASHLHAETSSVDCSSRIIELFEEVLSIFVSCKLQSVSSKRSSTPLECTASLAPVCRPLTYHPWLAFETRKDQAVNLIECELNCVQCGILIPIVSNDHCCG